MINKMKKNDKLYQIVQRIFNTGMLIQSPPKGDLTKWAEAKEGIFQEAIKDINDLFEGGIGK